MNTAEVIVRALEENHVEYIFGVPGAAIEDLNIALHQSGRIKAIVTKHEAGAAYMADGYARISGRLGACCTTAGPGATNLVTGLATAYRGFVPVCALTGQVATSVFGKGAVQESGIEGINLAGMFSNFTKFSYMLVNEKRTEYTVRTALRTALARPGGPIHLNLPTDVMKKPVDSVSPITKEIIPCAFDRVAVEHTAELLLNAKRPVIVAGWGAVMSRAAQELRELAELLRIPVVTSPKAKGIFPETNSLSLGVLGFAGAPSASTYVMGEKPSKVDVMLAVGTSFNDMMTNGWDQRIHPSQHLIQIDADPVAIGKNYPASVGIVGDAATVLKEIKRAVKRELRKRKNTSIREIMCARELFNAMEVNLLKAQNDLDTTGLRTEAGRPYHPRHLVNDIKQNFPDDTIYFADIGAVMAWPIRYMKMNNPYSFFVSLGFGGMGFATAAPVGAKLAAGNRPVVAMVGDGAFLMHGMEVATAVNYQIPVVWIIFNNAMYGLVHHGRKLFKEPVPEYIPSKFTEVNFAKVAEGLGARGIRIEEPGKLNSELVNEIIDEGRPTVIDVRIDGEVVPPIHNRISVVEKHFGEETPSTGKQMAETMNSFES